jgi:hypothetical protein
MAQKISNLDVGYKVKITGSFYYGNTAAQPYEMIVAAKNHPGYPGGVVLISEYAVGKGRLILCSLDLDVDDPAAKFLKAQLLKYLSRGKFAPAPEVTPETLKELCGKSTLSAAVTTDIAWDPNAGK